MATSTLTLQTATAASWDTGWTQSAGDAWTATSLVLTVTGAGSVDLELSCRDDDSTTVLYKQSIPWTASGTLTIPLPTPFYGQIRLRGSIQAGGTVAAAISGELPKLTLSPDGSTLVAPVQIRNVVRGQNIRGDGVLFFLGPGAAFANIAAETDCYTAPVAGLEDGGYVVDSADGGIPPVFRAGFLIPAGTEKSQGIRIDASCGISMAASTLASSTLASKLTLKAYLINLVTNARVQIASIDVRASQIANADPSTSLPCDFGGTLAPSSVDAGTTWNTRNHDFVLLASGNYGGQFAGFKEQSAYPKIDWGVDQGLVFTQQWDSGYPAGTFYFNTLCVKRG